MLKLGKTKQLHLKLCTFFTTFLFVTAQIGNDPGEFAEVKSLLSEIRTVSLIKRGQLFDYDPNVIKNQIAQANFHDGTEASINRNYIDDLFENDILLTVDQARSILQEVKDSPREGKKRRPRQAQPGVKYFWQSTDIPFKFYWDDADWQDLIHSAHRHIESHTCIRFIENGTGHDYLLYTRGSGCWSNVGRVGGRQQISIGYGCDAMGIVAHETLHALALWHEQSRSDRDEFIEIEWKNIFRGTESNFEKRTPKNSENYNQPYDMGSAMHYGAKAFSSDWDSYSIVTKDSNYQLTIGQRQTISFKDAKMINTRYCSKICPKELDCKAGGYTDPNQCEICKCPSGLGGFYCESLPFSNIEECREKGSELIAKSTENALNSPPLVSGLRCYWRIKAPRGQRVEIRIQSVSFECDNACSSFLEIKYKQQKVSTGARFCCDATKKAIVSEDQEVLIIYSRAKEVVTGWRGFQLTYKSVPLDGFPTPEPSPSANKKSKSNGRGGKIRIKELTTQETEEPTIETTPIYVTSPPVTTTSTQVSTTTKQLSTTQMSTTTTNIQTIYTGSWTGWAGWSGCTVSCGGCGKRKRVRACYGGNRECPGLPYEFGECGEGACNQSFKTTRCDGRLILPCDLLEKLDFGTTRLPQSIKVDEQRKHKTRSIRSVLFKDSNLIEMNESLNQTRELPFLPMTSNNAKILQEIHRENAKRSKRFVDGNIQLEMKIYCEKRFSYNCPTNLLTISMDWKVAKDTIMHSDSRICCEGYTSRAGKCQKS